MGRELTFADAKIIDLVNKNFVPVAMDDWFQRRRQDAEGEGALQTLCPRDASLWLPYRGACGVPAYSTVPGIITIWDLGSWNDCQACVLPCKSVATTL